ncbi:MAG: hypothetical protein WC829_02645 [Hyphomicrobium sp.]
MSVKGDIREALARHAVRPSPVSAVRGDVKDAILGTLDSGPVFLSDLHDACRGSQRFIVTLKRMISDGEVSVTGSGRQKRVYARLARHALPFR